MNHSVNQNPRLAPGFTVRLTNRIAPDLSTSAAARGPGKAPVHGTHFGLVSPHPHIVKLKSFVRVPVIQNRSDKRFKLGPIL